MILYILSFFLSLSSSRATIPTVLRFEHTANGIKLERNKTFELNDQQDCSIRQWKYYISHLEMITSSKASVKVPGIFLIDALGNDSIQLELPKGQYRGIKYVIGIDSTIHLSGAKDGALDPLNGMYWAWNTGYIHFKLEGEKQRLELKNTRFQYHIGGFSGHNSTIQMVELSFSKASKFYKKNISLPIVEVDIADFLNNDAVKKANLLIMKEGKEAVEISKMIPMLFSIKKSR